MCLEPSTKISIDEKWKKTYELVRANSENLLACRAQQAIYTVTHVTLSPPCLELRMSTDTPKTKYYQTHDIIWLILFSYLHSKKGQHF